MICTTLFWVVPLKVTRMLTRNKSLRYSSWKLSQLYLLGSKSCLSLFLVVSRSSPLSQLSCTPLYLSFPHVMNLNASHPRLLR